MLSSTVIPPSDCFHKCAVDIGGTLAKLVFAIEDKNDYQHNDRADCSADDALDLADLGVESELDILHTSNDRTIKLKFRYLKTKDIHFLIDWLYRHGFVGTSIPLTGGGSFKFQEAFQKNLNATILKNDEMLTVMTGLSFLVSQPDEFFRYDLITKSLITTTLEEPLYPFLVVNIGSGVSIIKADAPGSFKRITGTCVGGGTVLGLARLLLGVSTFDEVIDLSLKGTNSLDLVVSDIHGDAAGSHCLPSSTLASSFGRLYIPSRDAQINFDNIRPQDIARSLVIMVSYNLGYLSYLLGTIHKTYRVIFAGKFINKHKVTMEAITEGLRFYTRHYDAMGRFRKSRLPENKADSSRSRTQSASCPGQRLDYRERMYSLDTTKIEKNINSSNLYCKDFSGSDSPSPPLLAAHGYSIGLPQQDIIKSPSGAFPSLAHNATFDSYFGGGLQSQDFSNLDLTQQSDALLSEGNEVSNNTPGQPFEILFLRHDGYLGALGAMLLSSKMLIGMTMKRFSDIAICCISVLLNVRIAHGAPLSSIFLSPLHETLSPYSTPILDIIWQPLNVLKKNTLFSETVNTNIKKQEQIGPKTFVGKATSIIRDGAVETMGELADIRKIAEAAGKEALTQEALQLKQSANLAALASSILSTQLKTAAATAVKELESLSNTVESRLQNAALEALMKVKDESGALLSVGESAISQGANALKNLPTDFQTKSSLKDYDDIFPPIDVMNLPALADSIGTKHRLSLRSLGDLHGNNNIAKLNQQGFQKRRIKNPKKIIRREDILNRRVESWQQNKNKKHSTLRKPNGGKDSSGELQTNAPSLIATASTDSPFFQN